MKNNKVAANNAFVKREQDVIKSMMGDRPVLKAEAKKFNAYMCNNGESAEQFGRELTKDIDKKAFPVK